MHLRNDAVVAGSKLAVAVEEFAKHSGSVDTVATVGGFTVKPNAINSVPRSAVLEIDVRDIDLKRRDLVVEQIISTANKVASEQRVRVNVRMINKDDPATSGDSAMSAAELAASHLGHTQKRMVSRAYHDTLFIAKACSNVGMIFIPCFKGYSHRPDEHSTEDQMRKGVETLALTMAKLSRERPIVEDHEDVNEEHVKLPFFISEDDEENNNAKTDPPEPNDEL
jgi:ureidoglycolate amidohydrolase